MADSRDKSYVLNVMDTPGHPFSDEVTASMRLSDGVLIVVDCIEGMTFYVERLVKEALRQQLKIVLFLNKLDRLVLELKLPPADAYFKLKHTLDDINAVI
jgi:U5 small nuclear ribonucleoprotein component